MKETRRSSQRWPFTGPVCEIHCCTIVFTFLYNSRIIHIFFLLKEWFSFIQSQEVTYEEYISHLKLLNRWLMLLYCWCGWSRIIQTGRIQTDQNDETPHCLTEYSRKRPSFSWDSIIRTVRALLQCSPSLRHEMNWWQISDLQCRLNNILLLKINWQHSTATDASIN